ncbi:MAG: hemerythrin domain-containing protein [Alphaproteobacteria bacterium]|nr:hemerythrin domain-containing protein [Alphaproteobacteria bacterium]
MVELVWQKWFEVGHEAIDFEHKIFFTLIHKLQCVTAESEDKAERRRVMEEIFKYADFHFTSEENIMQDSEYGNVDAHKTIHRNLLRDLREAIAAYDVHSDNAEEIVTFLFNWLLEHTIYEDLNISKSVKEKQLRQFFKSAG